MIGHLPRITPTEIAEAAYEAKPARRKLVNGWPLPASRFRKSSDVELLARAAKAAFEADLAASVPPDWIEIARTALLAEVERRAPAADMSVLERYGLAAPIRLLSMGSTYSYDRLGGGGGALFPRARLNPSGELVFSADCSEPMPAAALEILQAREVVRAQKVRGYEAAASWAARELRRTGQAPTWAEIEEQFPRVGAWLASQRRIRRC
ncbi:hypothetical protein [Sphingomonas morindae]|uniref:Uncharacterized protein n=1 Tax=Sphingomonas morindae TaxID=1541170 RepID=A0ABY4X436_9SPHN|nr:hypothetical protein [Sphingomonas morindae]USI71643.1 hypothetical protein LHA26_09875 [Sphingomonas morindae]